MRILLCNDDGFDAPGLHLLAKVLEAWSADVFLVAPDRKWTAASHQLSFDRELTLTRRAERAYACSGTPADCVVAAMTLLFAEAGKPDLVLAGVNDKRNVAEDIAYSGTMAIAREATYWGVPAIAISQAAPATSEAAAFDTLRRLLPALWKSRDEWAADGHWLSVNLPGALPASVAQAHVGRDKIASGCDVLAQTPERIVYRIRRGRPGTSVPGDENAQLAAGRIAVVRHRWFADASLPASLVAAWNSALA
jgi:5'-nucleotidase